MMEAHLINHITVPCVCMSQHMPLQVIRLWKLSFIADKHKDFFHSIVLLNVFLEVNRSSDILLTLLTIIRLLSTVPSCVPSGYQIEWNSSCIADKHKASAQCVSLYVSSGQQIQRKYSCIADKYRVSLFCVSSGVSSGYQWNTGNITDRHKFSLQCIHRQHLHCVTEFVYEI